MHGGNAFQGDQGKCFRLNEEPLFPEGVVARMEEIGGSAQQDHGVDQLGSRPGGHPVAARGESEVTGSQGRENRGHGGIGGDVEIEVEKGMDSESAEGSDTAQHVGGPVAIAAGTNVARGAVDVFSGLDQARQDQDPAEGGHGTADQAVVNQGIEVIVMDPSGTDLNGFGAMFGKAVIEMTGANAPPKVILPEGPCHGPDRGPGAHERSAASFIDVLHPLLKLLALLERDNGGNADNEQCRQGGDAGLPFLEQQKKHDAQGTGRCQPTSS